MAKFCGKCGTPLNEKYEFCPQCGAACNKKGKEIKEKISKKTEKKSKKKLFIVFGIITIIALTAAIIFLLFGDGTKNENKTIEVQIADDIEVFKSKDKDKINKIIFSETEIPEEFDEFVVSTNSNDGSGIMLDLVEMADIEYVSNDDTTVVVKITAPDMSGFADRIGAASFPENTDDLKALIMAYAENAEPKTKEVVLEYQKDADGTVVVNYNNTDFLNMVTGNIADAYAKIYEQYLNELIEGDFDK